MLGTFLEISVHAPAIQDSLAFYDSLGFVQAPVGETWPHPYAVVTDGRLFLGLHASLERSPALTFVLPRLAHGIAQLQSMGVNVDEQQLGDDVFNRASFRDPCGLHVALLEARTFSPPPLDAAVTADCGYFSEFAIPLKDAPLQHADAARAFWEPLGFVAMEEERSPFPRTVLTSDRLNLALYRTRAFRQPLLTFEDPDMRARIASLRERGYALSDEMPDSLDEASNAVVMAPEGTRLLLMQSQE